MNGTKTDFQTCKKQSKISLLWRESKREEPRRKKKNNQREADRKSDIEYISKIFENR